MPSYYRDRRPKYYNRYELLKKLERQEAVLHALDDFFERISKVILPAKKRKEITDGYSEGSMRIIPEKQRKLAFYQLMYELRRDGLVSYSESAEDKIVKITAKGLLWLKDKQLASQLSLPRYFPAIEKTNVVTIVSYDIPEKIKHLRLWLGSTLKNLGFKCMQKSVWIGKVKLPSEFIADLTKLKLEKHVEIFEITKSGTLRHKI